MVEDFIAAVEEATGRSARRTDPNVRLCCPAHDDRNPSLSVSEGDDGRVLAAWLDEHEARRFRCDTDGCFERANTVHFQSRDGRQPGLHGPTDVEVRFACPEPAHDFNDQGFDGHTTYWIFLSELVDPVEGLDWALHLASKPWAAAGHATLRARVAELR
jgi:hypothetical protein